MRENMDVDNDVDENLLQQFSCMGTTDREVLIVELQKLVGNGLNPAGCAFFLDMNNWNLQAAVCSYYDYEAPPFKLPCMTFVADITIGEGESVCPSTRFIKTWRLKNSGEDPWPAGCKLKFLQGDHFGHRNDVLVEHSLPINETTDISVEMMSPEKPGIYQGRWLMSTPNGYYFGEVIWVILTVSESGMLGLTQQMSSFNELGSPPRNELQTQTNPFAGALLPNQTISSLSLDQVDGGLNCSNTANTCKDSNIVSPQISAEITPGSQSSIGEANDDMMS